MKYPIANNYVETMKRVEKQLFDIAFTERHPEPLTYEEIQALAYEVNTLDIMELYKETDNSDSIKLYKGQFSDILSNPLVVNGTARNRLTILPYYPAGVTIESDTGNKVVFSMGSNGLIGSEIDSEGNTVATHSVISYLFDGAKITKRLVKEGWDRNTFKSEDHKLFFFFSQLNQLQEAIFERWEDVRIMFDYLEKPNLKKYKDSFSTAILEKAKEKPEAWKRKPTIIADTIDEKEFDSILAERQRFTSSRETFNMNDIKDCGKHLNLHTFLTKNGKGCLKSGTNWNMLRRALEYGALTEISNGNRLDILLYVFTAYADKYVHMDERDKYKNSINEQIESFGKKIKPNLHTDEMKLIKRLLT